jgi:tetratricopeptide (TPR) repeat protein
MRAARRAQPCFVGLFSLLLLLCPSHCVDAAPPDAKRCDKEGAERAFLAGMRQYDKLCREVIPRLEEAAQLCPTPDQPWLIHPNPFLEYSYLPFYFLGKCHYKLKDMPGALRQFYLSSCTGEPKRDKEKTSDLGPLTAGCRQELKSRPSSYFNEGFTAAQQRDWKEAAEKMWDALQVAEETGETKLPTGRWPVPYLPRLRLSEALLQLGCYQEACAQLGQSKLKQLGKDKKELAPELQRLQELESLCASKKSEPPQQKEMCQQWSCWLQSGGP